MTPTEELHRDLALSWLEIQLGHKPAEARHENFQRTYRRLNDGNSWVPLEDEIAERDRLLEQRRAKRRATDWDNERSARDKRLAAKSLEVLPPHPAKRRT